MQAEPINESLINDIEDGIINSKMDITERSNLLTERHEWDSNEALKLWCFGPDKTGPNVLVDTT